MPGSAVVVEVRPMAADDAGWAAELHQVALPHGLFPSLGTPFLRRYLATYVHGPSAVAFVAELAARPAGFLVGTLDHRRHREHVIGTHLRPLAVRGAVAVLFRPKVAWRFVRTRLVRYVGALLRPRQEAADAGADQDRVAVLAHVAVLPPHRGIGVGSELVRAFLESARDAGAERCELVTRADDEGADDFYRRLGWHRIGESLDRDGVRWTRLGHDLG
jgi:ribosomal protein S18 acetylase RimI-like enzyme